MAATTFEQDVQEKVASYLDGETMSSGLLTMLTDLAVECFKEIRNYPNTYTSEQVEVDMRKRINQIAYGIVEVYGKVGVEGHGSFSENGISRTFRDGLISTFNDIIPLVHVRY